MTDEAKALVERLRSFRLDDSDDYDAHVEAADLIETQAREIERLRGALRLFRGFGCPVCNGDCGAANPSVMCCSMQEADAALSKEPRQTFTRSDNV